jgi:hypothetical protein
MTKLSELDKDCLKIVKSGKYYDIVYYLPKYSIFDKEGNQVSDWFYGIQENGLIDGKSEYFLAGTWVKGVGIRYGSLVHIKKGIVFEAEYINCNYLLNGSSEYFIAGINTNFAIFHKSGKRISEWYEYIHNYGLVKGDGELYVAEKRNGFHVEETLILDKNGNVILSLQDEFHVGRLDIKEVKFLLKRKYEHETYYINFAQNRIKRIDKTIALLNNVNNFKLACYFIRSYTCALLCHNNYPLNEKNYKIVKDTYTCEKCKTEWYIWVEIKNEKYCWECNWDFLDIILSI